MKQFISRSDVKFVLVILGVVVSGTFFIAGLRSDINAMVSREQANRVTFFEMAGLVEETHDTVIKIQTNQKHIMRELGIEISD